MAHTDASILEERLREAERLVSPGSRYAHYKHPDAPYRIMALGLMEIDEAVAVVYQAETAEKLTFIRPLDVFLETVQYEGKVVPRFTRLS